MMIYSWHDFGREAEFVVANYLKLRGWKIAFSSSSRGAADMDATKDGSRWCIQVKASTKSPRIRSEEITRLKTYAASVDGLPVFATVQPWQNNNKDEGAAIGSYTIFLYSMDDWKLLRA